MHRWCGMSSPCLSRAGLLFLFDLLLDFVQERSAILRAILARRPRNLVEALSELPIRRCALLVRECRSTTGAGQHPHFALGYAVSRPIFWEPCLLPVILDLLQWRREEEAELTLSRESDQQGSMATESARSVRTAFFFFNDTVVTLMCVCAYACSVRAKASKEILFPFLHYEMSVAHASGSGDLGEHKLGEYTSKCLLVTLSYFAASFPG